MIITGPQKNKIEEKSKKKSKKPKNDQKKSSMLQFDAAAHYFLHEDAMQCVPSTCIINLSSIPTSEIFCLS